MVTTFSPPLRHVEVISNFTVKLSESEHHSLRKRDTYSTRKPLQANRWEREGNILKNSIWLRNDITCCPNSYFNLCYNSHQIKMHVLFTYSNNTTLMYLLHIIVNDYIICCVSVMSYQTEAITSQPQMTVISYTVSHWSSDVCDCCEDCGICECICVREG